MQCKFYEGKIISLNNLSTFLTKLQSGVGDIRFKRGIIISTSNLSSKALNEIEQVSKSIPINIISEEDFINSSIDWVKLDPTQTQGELPLQAKKKPRAHQEEAINAVKEYFSETKHTRGKLIMACGTGKTYTSLKIIESLEPKPNIVLFLAPSIALVSQTFREYCAQRSEPFVASIVCSDSKSGQSEDDISFSELPIAPSTRTEDILTAYERVKKENKRFIIFSTYQSALRIKEAQSHGLDEIDLMICDEAHRSVGAMYSLSKSDREAMLGDMGDEAYNSFTICHSNEHIKAKKRLYMTATPKVYKDNAKVKAQESEIKDLDKAVNNTNFQNIWRVLKSLRSHDPSLVDEAVFKEKIKIVLSDDTPITTDPSKKDKKDNAEDEQEKKKIQTLFDEKTLNALADAVYNVMPTKLGDKGYWESFSAKTAKIAETLNMRLRAIFAKKPLIFQDFLASLRESIHEYIQEDEALDMICSHIITKPIFDVIFGESVENPIGKALDKVLDKVSELGLEEEEIKYLDKLYKSVKENAEIAKSQKSKQELIKNLYDTFLRTAFKKQSEKLGIVYTPIEVVDFILRATNDILKKHFNTSYNDPSVKVFDPFTGTGSFITRLLAEDNNLISQEALREKFEKGLFAQDIVFLSYYIVLINITQTAQSRDSSLGNFKNIALADSLDYLENKSNHGVLPDFEKRRKTAIVSLTSM